jgi:hypothetical protein
MATQEEIPAPAENEELEYTRQYVEELDVIVLSPFDAQALRGFYEAHQASVMNDPELRIAYYIVRACPPRLLRILHEGLRQARKEVYAEQGRIQEYYALLELYEKITRPNKTS